MFVGSRYGFFSWVDEYPTVFIDFHRPEGKKYFTAMMVKICISGYVNRITLWQIGFASNRINQSTTWDTEVNQGTKNITVFTPENI